MKECFSCKEEKPFSHFGKASRNIDGLNYRCKECYYEYRKAWYHNNKLSHKSNVDARRKKVSQEIFDWMAEYLFKNPCVDCGESDILVLEFDHINDDKEYNVSYLVKYLNVEKLQKEIAKCEVRCVNCHKKVTNKRRNAVKK